MCIRDRRLGERMDLADHADQRDRFALVGDGDGPDALLPPVRRFAGNRLRRLGRPVAVLAARGRVRAFEQRVDVGVQDSGIQVGGRGQGHHLVDGPGAHRQGVGVEHHRVDAVHAAHRVAVQDQGAPSRDREAHGADEGVAPEPGSLGRPRDEHGERPLVVGAHDRGDAVRGERADADGVRVALDRPVRHGARARGDGRPDVAVAALLPGELLFPRRPRPAGHRGLGETARRRHRVDEQAEGAQRERLSGEAGRGEHHVRRRPPDTALHLVPYPGGGLRELEEGGKRRGRLGHARHSAGQGHADAHDAGAELHERAGLVLDRVPGRVAVAVLLRHVQLVDDR